MAKLIRVMGPLVAAAALAVFVAACAESRPSEDPRVKPAYAKDGRLGALDYDADADGKTDTRVFMDGSRPLRAELDPNQDGRVDRWEYFDENGRIEKVGTASAGDGAEDTWTYVGPKGEIERVERFINPPGVVRREHYEGGGLRLVEVDSNKDGRFDRWETYEAGVVAVLALDTMRQRGQPNRKLYYGAGGRVERIEADPDGDGVFTTVPVDPISRP